MSSNSLLARLAERDGRSRDAEAGPDGDSWIVREQRLFRIYFGMGLAASAITGAASLLVLLALATGPGYERWGWFGNTKSTSTMALYDALPRPAVAAPGLGGSGPEMQRGMIPEVQQAPGSEAASMPTPNSVPQEAAAPPLVRVVAVTPAPSKPIAAAAPAAPSTATAPQASARKAHQVAAKSNTAPAVPSALPAPTSIAVPGAELPAETPRTETAVGDPVQRPQGLLNLGGPGTATATGEADRVWWRQVWWGTAALPWMQKPAVPAR